MDVSSDEEPDVNFQISKYFNTIKTEENTGASTSGLQRSSTSKLQNATTPVHYKSSVSDCFSGRPTLKSPMASFTIPTDPSATSSKSSTSHDTEKVEAINDYEARCLEEVALLDKGISVNIQMSHKYNMLTLTLIKRIEELYIKLREVRYPEATYEATTSFRYIHCGKPYFKKKDLTPAPSNEDTLKMKSLGMYDFSNIRPVSGWTVKDKSDLMSLLLKMSQQKKIQELRTKIADIQAGKSDIKCNLMDSVIDTMTKEIAAIAKKDLNELALPIREEYDWETIASLLKYRHSASEYRSLWKLFLHPSINKKTWSITERENLLNIAKANKYQDWDKIATDLNTGRSGYQCFVYYRTNVKSEFVGKKWTKEEEDVLKKTVEHYREGNYIPWGKIAASIKNRTKISIYNKYMHLCAKRKGRFCPEEDTIILTCVKKFGANFTNIKKHLPGRTINQIRNRYQTLKKNRISTVWTVEEDKKLVQLLANQDGENLDYSGVSKFFPGKDRINLRTRFQTLSKWMKSNPNLDISFAPRRGARLLAHGSPAEDLNKAVKTLEAKMISKDTQKSKAITAASSEQDIEDAIVACLTTEAINQRDKYHDEIPINLDEPHRTLNASNVNITNLQKILILLRSQINAESFRNSKDYDKFHGLDDSKQTVSTVTIKSYSRKKAIQTLTRHIPDIYGNKRLPTLEYILPPNYDTLTACRILIKYVTENKPKPQLVAKLMNKKNPILKQQLSLLIERFKTLYVWPLLLSNRGPSPGSIDSTEDPQLVDVFKNVKIVSIKTLEDSDDETKDANLTFGTPM